jgi:hypothetical protein
VKSTALLLLSASVLSAQQPKPFDLSFGPQENGTFGVVAKGSHFKSLRRAPSEKQSGQLLSLFAGVEIDGSWNSATDARNNTSIALRPAFALQTITPRVIDGKSAPTTAGPWLYAYVDIRQRFGDFENEDMDRRRLNQLILGGALQLRWAGFAKWYSQAADVGREDNPPTLSIGYYTVQKNQPEDEPLPRDVVADAIQGKLSSRITLPICTKETREAPRTADDPFGSAETVYDCPWSFVGELLATKLTTGGRDFDFRYDVGVIYDAGGAFKPILRFRSGEEHGLEYDRMFLLGLLWALPI